MHASMPFRMTITFFARADAIHDPSAQAHDMGCWKINIRDNSLITYRNGVERRAKNIPSLDAAIQYIMDSLSPSHPLASIPHEHVIWSLASDMLNIFPPWGKPIHIPLDNPTAWTHQPNITDLLGPTATRLAAHPDALPYLRGIVLDTAHFPNNPIQHIPHPNATYQQHKQSISMWNIDYSGYIHLIVLPIHAGPHLTICMLESHRHTIQHLQKIVFIDPHGNTVEDMNDRTDQQIIGECRWPCTPDTLAKALISLHTRQPSRHAGMEWIRQWSNEPSTHPTIMAILDAARTHVASIQAWHDSPVMLDTDMQGS